MNPLPPEPVVVPVTFLDLILNSGQAFSAVIREDRGDVIMEVDDTYLTVKFGNGEVTCIARREIALMTTRKGTITLPQPKIDPTTGPAENAGIGSGRSSSRMRTR